MLTLEGFCQPVCFRAAGDDLTARDASVKPGDDFYRYANGHWVDTHQIPADRARWGTFDELAERADDNVRKLIQGLPEHAAPESIEDDSALLSSYPREPGPSRRSSL